VKHGFQRLGAEYLHGAVLIRVSKKASSSVAAPMPNKGG
jgi:hypothetical protein